jgi:hypothetical protein
MTPDTRRMTPTMTPINTTEVTEMSDAEPKPSIAVGVDIDSISLEAALLDAEVAIRRSRDLMLRLVELRAELATERERTGVLSAELQESRRLYDEIVNNRAYRSAAKAWAIRGALGV